MRRRLLAGLVIGGCITENPAWDGAATAGGAAATSSETGGGPPGTGDAPTTGDAPSSTGGVDETSTGPVIPPTSSETTDASSEDDATTAPPPPPPPTCEASERLVLELDVADTGVVPTSLGSPCAWGGGQDCGPVNFGSTHFYRLVRDPAGVNAALLRFETPSLTAAAAAAGVDPTGVIGLRLEVVVWEPKFKPDAPYTLEILALAPENVDFGEGDKDAAPGDEGDASDNCRTITGGQCVPWAGGGRALDGSTWLGDLLVTEASVAEHDKDQSDNEYHAQLLSEPLTGADSLFAAAVPALAVRMKSPRLLGEAEVGIKFDEAPVWEKPRLFVEVCTQWAP